MAQRHEKMMGLAEIKLHALDSLSENCPIPIGQITRRIFDILYAVNDIDVTKYGTGCFKPEFSKMNSDSRNHPFLGNGGVTTQASGSVSINIPHEPQVLSMFTIEAEKAPSNE